jgi:pilus assembly protein FimV
LKTNSFLTGRFALNTVALATMLFASAQVMALGLGRLAVQSNLGETLKADIDVSSLTPEEASNLQVKVASPEAYRAAGVDYNAVLPGTKVVLQRRPDGKAFLRVTSDRVVQEPFVDVILEITSSSGRLVREYTMLFDPPTTKTPAAPPPTETAPSFSSAGAASERPAKAERRSSSTARPATAESAAPRAPRKVAAAPAVQSASAGADEYKVRAGDSLSRIAGRVQKPGVSLDQMLVALYQANPQAFINSNMNRLKAGVVLAVPTPETAKATSAAEAKQIIQAQSSDFGAYRQRLGGSVATSAKTEGPSRQAKGTVQAAVDDAKQSATPKPDKLTLTKGSPKASAPEARLSKEQEQKESNARVAELAKNVEDLKKLSSASAASGGRPAAVSGSASSGSPGLPLPAVVAPKVPIAASAVAAAASVPAPKEVVLTPPVVASVASAAAPASTPVAVQASTASAVSAEASAPPLVAASAAKPAPRVVPPVAEVVDASPALWENPLALAAGGGLLALLAGFGIFKFMKRAKKDSGETSFLESRLQPDSFFGASGGQRVDTRDGAGGASSSMSYSLSQLDAIGDVDPVAEADVYLAYGRDLQAEEILKEAMRTSPERLAIRTKLLEVYAKRRDTKGFELLATQLFGLTGGQGEDWLKAQEIGRQIEPENPLYQDGGVPSATASSERGRSSSDSLGASTMPQSVLSAKPEAADSRSGGLVSSFNSISGSEVDLDLDLVQFGNVDDPAPVVPSKAVKAADKAIGHNALDFNLSPTVPSALDEKHSPAPMDFDMSGISLDLNHVKDEVTIPVLSKKSAPTTIPGSLDFQLNAPDDSDPIARKLALADEFRQIGDFEGARELLQEVIAGATGTVKSKAQAMLDELD